MRYGWVWGLLVFLPAAGLAQTYVYPKQGQSAQQTQQDQAECRAWASQQSAAAAPTQPQTTGPARGAARGAVLGGIAGGLTDRDAGDTAAAGAAVGGTAGIMRRRDERRQQQQDGPERAFAACMEGRGYSVK
ncbi:MAG: hypothetical protein NVV74_23900 [Magnetospirillum sp.]|nr:hypothetical protein [Magnetospirillum sp.]